MEDRPEIIKKRSIVINSPDENIKNGSDFQRRALSGLFMMGAFLLIIGMGPIPIVLLIFAIQLLVFKEVISVAHMKSMERRLPWFRTTTW